MPFREQQQMPPRGTGKGELGRGRGRRKPTFESRNWFRELGFGRWVKNGDL